jgi:predicted transcriptional regulator
VTDIDKAAVLDELIALSGTSDIEQDEWTVNEYAARAACGYNRAQREIKRLLQTGVVTRRRAIADGRRVWAYRKTE